jgi:hypothetical protein
MITTLIVLNLCHWAADYTHLSTGWMLNAKRLGKPFFPILAHAGVHALLFFLAVLALHGIEGALISAAIQLPTHFFIDVLKGRMNGWFPSIQSPSNKFHWWAFGADQFLHQLVIIVITYFTYA